MAGFGSATGIILWHEPQGALLQHELVVQLSGVLALDQDRFACGGSVIEKAIPHTEIKKFLSCRLELPFKVLDGWLTFRLLFCS